MTDINDLKKQLKVQWGVLRDKNANPAQKSAAKAEINKLEKEAGFEITDFAANQKAFEARKASGTTSTSGTAPYKPIEKFVELEPAQQAATLKQARKLFEKKNLIEKVASEEFPQYNNGASVGQILGIIEQ